MENYQYFTCQFDAEQLFLGGHCCLRGKEVLERLFNEDFRKPKTLLLVHPKKHFAYYHEYVKSPQRNTYIIRVYNQRILVKAVEHFHTKLELDHPYLIVLVDLNDEQPKFLIEKCYDVATSTEEVAQVLTHSLNIALKGFGWKMRLGTLRDRHLSHIIHPNCSNCGWDFVLPNVSPSVQDVRSKKK